MTTRWACAPWRGAPRGRCWPWAATTRCVVEFASGAVISGTQVVCVARLDRCVVCTGVRPRWRAGGAAAQPRDVAAAHGVPAPGKGRRARRSGGVPRGAGTLALADAIPLRRASHARNSKQSAALSTPAGPAGAACGWRVGGVWVACGWRAAGARGAHAQRLSRRRRRHGAPHAHQVSRQPCPGAHQQAGERGPHGGDKREGAAAAPEAHTHPLG